MGVARPTRFVRFGAFQLDLRAGELRRNGVKLRVPDQSIQVLAMLLNHPGDVVTRGELHRRLWPNGTIVEFEHGINAVINRLRQALEDSAGAPRFIETLPRRGYRFLVPVERTETAEPAGAAEPEPATGGLEGKTVSHYRVLRKLGQGAMGVVYQAEDTKLGRQVALKFIHEELSDDPRALERFEREARAASSLNHPNICTVHEVEEHEGEPFIVMEYVIGKSVDLLVGPGGLRANKLLSYAVQIADALAKAHSAGIIHRDLKPSNIMVNQEGLVKLLDFGLAKVCAARPAADLTALPAETPLTGEGTILGTLQYMAPEQLEGKDADARSDIFAFGAVIYEMATGRRAFEGNSQASLIAAILEREPPRQLNPELPADLERIINKALAKDREIRYHFAEEILVDLKRLKRDTVSGATVGQTGVGMKNPRTWRALALFALAVTALLVAVVVSYVTRKPAGTLRTPNAPVQTAHGQITFVGDAEFPAISPDGTLVAYVTGSQQQRLMLRDLKGGQAIELLKAFHVWRPRWSPDGSELALGRADEASSGVVSVPRLGGTSRFMAPGAYFSWSPDGSRVAVAWQNEKGFRIVDRVSGSSKTISLSGFEFILDLDWSPTSSLLAILTYLQNGRSAVWTVRPDGSQYRKLIEEDRITSPRWSATGDSIYFLHQKDFTAELSTVPVDSKTGQAIAPPSALWTGLQVGDYFTVSADGQHLVYTRSQGYSNLWLAQLKGSDKAKGLQTRPLTHGTSTLHSLSISPDGKWIAFVNGLHIQKMPIDGGIPVQLTFSDFTHASTAWSPDGKRIAFGSNEGGANKVWIVDADGTNLRQFRKTDLSPTAIAWAPGPQIVYEKPGNKNFGTLDPATEDETPLLKNPVGWLNTPKYSPDAKKVAVYWNRSPRGLWVISITDNSATCLKSGDFWPAGWSADGNSIYALAASSENIAGSLLGERTAQSAPTIEGAIVSIPAAGGSPKTMAQLPGRVSEVVISPDGKRLLYDAVEAKSDVWVIENFDPSHRTR